MAILYFLSDKLRIVRILMGISFLLVGVLISLSWIKGEPIILSYNPVIEFNEEPVRSIVGLGFVAVLIWGFVIIVSTTKKIIKDKKWTENL